MESRNILVPTLRSIAGYLVDLTTLPTPDDTQSMLDRASSAGVKSMIVIGGSLEESERAVQLAQQHGLYATVGCHPTRSTEFDKFKGGPDAYLSGLEALISKHRGGKGRVVAIGECGLGASFQRSRISSS